MPHLQILDLTQANFEGVHFGIRSDGFDADIRLPGWNQQTVAETHHIPGSGRSITFQMGMGPMTITYRVEFESRRDYHHMKALVGSTGTLQIPTRICELAQTEPNEDTGIRAVEVVEYFGTLYTRITEVILQGIGQPLVGDGDWIETTLAFQRNEWPE